jgi:hypothetical protein
MIVAALVIMVLEQAPAGPATLSGQMVDLKGEPVAGATVFQSGDSPARTEVETGLDGRFKLDGVVARPMVVFARKPVYRFAGLAIAPESENVTLMIRKVDEPPNLIRKTLHERRAAIFRLGVTGLTFSYAAAGYLEGQVQFAGRWHVVRRMDGDGNGLFTDLQDRLWIDLNDDVRWDSSSEQFLFASILPIGETRYAVRSDPFGQRLSVAPLEGSGTVRLVLAKRRGLPAAVEVAATLIGRDGSSIGLSGERAQATVPIGEYRLGTVTCAFEDAQGGPRWNFVFSDIDRRGEASWHTVEKGGTVAIDPIGALEFKTGMEQRGRGAPVTISSFSLSFFRRRPVDRDLLSGLTGKPRRRFRRRRHNHAGQRRPPHCRHRPFRLCLRHLLLGLRASAFVSASPTRLALRPVRLRPSCRPPPGRFNHSGRHESLILGLVLDSVPPRLPTSRSSASLINQRQLPCLDLYQPGRYGNCSLFSRGESVGARTHPVDGRHWITLEQQ